MNKIKTAVIFMTCLALVMLGTTACTDNTRAKTFGGKLNIALPNCTKLVNATWKDSNLWYQTRPFRADEAPETTTFQENSKFGVMEGTVFFTESCKK